MTRTKPGAVALLLLLVLLGHALFLSWFGEQAQQFKPLTPMADPLFTRFIEPARPALPPPRPRSRPARAAVPPSPPPAEVEAPEGTAAQAASAESPDPQPAVDAEAPEPAAQAIEASPEPVTEVGPPADSWPPDTRVSYRLQGYYGGKLYGSARVQWQREHSRYQVRLDLSVALLLQFSMISQGDVGAASLLPGAYEEQLPWGLRRMAFEGGLVRFHNGSQLPQPPALQDTVSQFVELSHRFSSGQAVLQVGSPVSLWLARPNGMALWTYDVVEQEILQTPELGAVPAFHLRPRPIANPTGSITAEIWFAPSLQYLPVRVRIALGGDNFIDLLVERIEQGVAPAPPQFNWRDGR